MFFVLVSLILGLLNYYLFRTAAHAFPSLAVFFATSVALLYLSLFAAVLLEKRGKLALSLPFSWIGYTWLGMSGIAFTLTAPSDLAQVLGVPFSDRAQFIGIAAATSVLSLWAAFEARRFRVNRIELRSPKLKGLGKPLRIAQISDLHLGDSSSLKRTKKVVQTINLHEPHLVVSTGDLFDGYLELMAPFVDCLRELEAPLGKFAVSGNHEVYAGLDEAMSLTELAGFSPLRNRSQSVNEFLTVAGVEDPASPLKPDEAAALDTLSQMPFHLLLKHRPDFDPKSKGKFDLQLSGHTHGGQIAPFLFLTKLAYKAKLGLSELAPKQFLYLSRGTGSWGPQLRLLAPPEITIFELKAG
ncbi:metallophosphoesterase [Pelagicoccus sp. SDUM812005]|uniref:metallophosphoesterase n=1 Tax=Pelagicoccus sp. SDUM812005 TaxID=3041257 RepID=UPI00280E5F12|nr:metallophosphoesterase [Pelagicoccus sp. SDUM812005]MDQ8182475.1 metallophosphoesterase [Pelagicoccus sp. SDUM812005]